jgi:hypothetical protein
LTQRPISGSIDATSRIGDKQARHTLSPFRLADSLPTQKLATLIEQKKGWLALNPPPHKENQITEYHRNFSQRVHE